MAQVANVLVCAGLDPSGGAGLLADAHVITACGARPCGAITAQTVQSSQGVSAVVPINPKLLRAQLDALIGDMTFGAVKIGMLGSIEIAQAIVAALASVAVPVIWDPVAMPTHGDSPLFRGNFADAVTLFSSLRDVIITPNAVELATLAGRPLNDSAATRAAAVELAHATGMQVFVKGGHLTGSEVTDALVERVGALDAPANAFHVVEFTAPRLATPPGGVHGTGCAAASAIAAHLARGAKLADACRLAQVYVRRAIAAPVQAGRGTPSVV